MKNKLFIAVAMLSAIAVLFSSCKGNDPIDVDEINNTGNDPTDIVEINYDQGMYVGVTGFSDVIEYYASTQDRYNVLTKSNMEDYCSFINGLKMGDATVLYYAVDNNLSYLQRCKFPEDLSSVNIITFTDGLNQGSVKLDQQDGNHDYAADDGTYVAEIHRKIETMTVQGLPINAYAIGIRGKDVAGDAATVFENNLLKLSSTSENAMEVSNMDEVSMRFKEIAASLYKKTESTNLTITIPMPSNNEIERFTFDDISEASASNCYIEGVYTNGTLTNIKYVGCMSNSGTTVNEQDAGGVKIKFEFENFTNDKGQSVSTKYMQQWHMSSGQSTWTRNSEFKPAESIEIKEERKTAVVMLILDCSSSLGDDFKKVKIAANDFIRTLAGETVDNQGTDPGIDLSKVRFRKENGYIYWPMMGLYDTKADDFVVFHYFGTESGTSSYYDISSDTYEPLIYYYDEADENEASWYYAMDEYTWTFAPKKKYTFSMGDDGDNIVCNIYEDGSFNAPAQSKVVYQKRIRKSDLNKAHFVRK